MENKLRIFEFKINGETEWVAAITVIHAILVHSSATNMDLWEYDQEDEIIELPKSKWKENVIKDADGEEEDISFYDWIKQAENKADFMATTVY